MPGYARNFLKKVICRLDFPVILRLRGDSPAALQETLKSRFPKSAESVVLAVKREESVTDGAQLKIEEPVTQWEFRTRDNASKLTLSRSFLVLETQAYAEFAPFYESFAAAFSSLQEQYSPQVYTRLGLRYINVVERERGDALDWAGWFAPELIAHLRFAYPGALLQAMERTTVQTGSGRAVLQYGINNPDFPAPIVRREFVLDIDCYTDEDMEPGEVISKLGSLNVDAVDLFERAVGCELRKRLEGR